MYSIYGVLHIVWRLISLRLLITFTRKANVLNYQYRLENYFILRTDYIKGLGVCIDCELHFHRHVDFPLSGALKWLGLILLMLYFALVRCELEHISVSWNFVMITDSNKLERIQRKLAANCHSRFFEDMRYHYDNLLERSNLLTHYNRRHFDALLLINIFSWTKWCLSVLETIVLRVPIWNIRNFTMFICSSSHFPWSRCVSATNVVCKHRDIFGTSYLNVKSLNWSIFLYFVSLFCFVLCCFIAVVVCLRTVSVIGHWLLSLAHN
jgi:hypothetical protein